MVASLKFGKRVGPVYIAVLAAVVMGGCVSLGSGERARLRAKDRVAPALVHIRPVKEVFAEGKRSETVSIGSGFVVTADGYVLTNEHVAGESRQVHCVLSDKSEVEAEVVGVDPYTDLAVLKLEAPQPLPHVRLGDSDELEAGQTVLALGSPHGLARSVSQGIVSVTDRYMASHGSMVSPYNTWIQTDAAINPGNSGGPLVNLKGEVVGVNSRRLMGADNVGFAIPINIAKEVMDAIVAEGRVRRSWIGVNLQEMLARTEDPKQAGVVVGDVEPLSPALEAGILPGDVLLAVNGTPTNARFEEDLPAVLKCIADLPIGSTAVLDLQRAGKAERIEVVTEEKSALRGDELAFDEWGFTLAELTPAIVRRARLDRRQGVWITGSQVGGVAANAGLQGGDVVLEVDGVMVENLAHFQRIYEELLETKKELTMFLVKRGALTRYALVKQDAAGKEEADHEE